MARLKVVLPRSNSTRRFRIRRSSGASRVMGYAPRTAEFSQNAPLGIVDRPGRKPITRVTGPGVRTLRFTQTVASMDWKKSIETDLSWIKNCGASGHRIKFYGLSNLESSVWWRIQNIDISIEQRTPTNKPSRAKVSWDLIEATDVSVRAAKAVKKRRSPKKKATRKVSRKVSRTYKVKKGDTLGSIAKRRLGRATRWPEIYKLNRSKIKNPNRIFPGQVLKLPAK